jgi:ribosome biogenesis GTPase A
MQIQWYPGHMTKAKRAMKEDIKLIDLVIELVDARVPLGSRNPDIDELAKGKGRIVLLNKADLADDGCTERWIAWFKEQGIHALRINARSGMGMKQIQPLVQEALEYGNVSGWLCVQGRGAIPSLPTRQEIERHLV